MTTKQMPQRLFNFGAASIARMHLISGTPLPSLAALVLSATRELDRDAGVERDWIDAAERGLRLLQEREAPSPEAILHHFQYFIDQYEPDGRPRRRYFWSTAFRAHREQNPRRKEDFLALLDAFYARARAGLVPLAPPGWPDDGSAFRELFAQRPRRAP